MHKATSRGTLIGATAILMWATLATLTTLSGDVPPFQLLAMCFSIAALLGLIYWRREGAPLRDGFQLPGMIWALGIYGLFGYHFAYFMALRNAPPVDASLIAYLWPLLIVVMTAFLPGERLRPRHVIGALAGFAGAALLVTRGESLSLDPRYLAGYLFALACAIIWSTYSVGSRLAVARYSGRATTGSVGAFCAATAVLALGFHLLFEETAWPVGPQWLAVLLLGLGPVGLAFYTWDYGVKHGSLGALGSFAYAAPLLSTLLLIALGLAEPSWSLAAACALIVGGAVLASADSWRR